MNRLLLFFISGQMCLWAVIPMGMDVQGSPQGVPLGGFRERHPAFVNAALIDHAVLVGSRDEKAGPWLVSNPLSGMFLATRHPFLASFGAASGHEAFVSALLYTQTTSTRL